MARNAGSRMKVQTQAASYVQSRGYTMIELMTVLAIAMILLAVGVPSFNSLLQAHRMTTTVNNFFAAVNLARSEAIHRGVRVDLVPADGIDWAKGWIVLVDQNGDQNADPGEQIIFSHGPVPKGLAIKSGFTDSKKPYLAYNGAGRTRTNANSQTPQLGSWSFTLDDHVRRIVVNFLGRPRVCNPKVETTTC